MLSVAYSLQQRQPVYEAGAPRLLDHVRDVIRRKHYSLRTEDIYVDWVRRFVRFCDLRHPRSAELRTWRRF